MFKAIFNFINLKMEQITRNLTYNKVETLYDVKDADGFICSFSHLTSQKDYRDVYEPSEDSFLLIDALQMDLGFIKDEIDPFFIMEVG